MLLAIPTEATARMCFIIIGIWNKFWFNKSAEAWTVGGNTARYGVTKSALQETKEYPYKEIALPSDFLS